jgi:hypothetical protein
VRELVADLLQDGDVSVVRHVRASWYS